MTDFDIERQHERYAAWDGAYVVGALLPAERAEFERHLVDCAECRAAVTALAPLPGLLARVDPEDAAALMDAEPLPAHLAAPPGDLEQRVLAAAGHSRPTFWRRTSTRVGIGIAAAAAVAAAVVVPIEVRGSDGPAPAEVQIALKQTVRSPVTADVALTPVRWGTRIDMTCWYAGDSYAPQRAYSLYLVDSGGERSLVSSWHAAPGETARTSGSTDLDVADIRQIQLRDVASGKVLLTGRPTS